jgi:hypothetical protein
MVLGGEKSPILEEKAQRHSSRGRNGHRRSMSDVSSTLHPLLKRGEIIQRKIKGIQTGGAAPRRVQARGAAPRGE